MSKEPIKYRDQKDNSNEAFFSTQSSSATTIYSPPSNSNIPVTAPYSQHSLNASSTTTGKTQLEVKNKRTAVSIPSRLAKGEFADVIKEKIKQGANANSQYQSLLEKLVDPDYKELVEFLKEEMRRIRKEASNVDFQAYLTWLENNYGNIGHSETSGKFEEEAIDLYIREEREVQIRRWNVPNIPPYFIGREHLLEHLAQRLSSKEGQTAMVILTALHGLGGVGKTFLAARYAQLYAETYNFILWFNAESETTLTNDYRHFADTFYLPIEGQSPENILIIIKNWLEQQSNWLIIYDNAPDDKLITKFRPAKGGKILITSRKESWNKKDSLAIDVFSLEEARAYIVELTGFSLDEHQDKIDELAKTLGFLPLALAQACAYITARKISLEKYLVLYAGNRAAMLAKSLMPPESNYKFSVAITWNITFKAIEEEQPTAIPLLESCAFLQGNTIPEFLLEHIFMMQQPALVNQLEPFIDALGCLQQYSILKLISQEKEKVFSLHNLVQEVIFDTLSNKGKQTYLVDIILLLRVIFPDKEVEQIEDYAKQRILLPHLEKSLHRVEECLGELKNDQGAEEFSVISVRVIEKELYAPLLVLSAHSYNNLGNARKQKELLERALGIQEQHYGKDHPSVARILVNLANANSALGDVCKQKELLERALVIQKPHYGKDHPEVARTLVNLATANGALGDVRKLKELLERALVIQVPHYGKDHPVVARTLVNLANAAGALGDARQQKELLERALVIKESHYGKDHPVVAVTLNNLANANGALGDTRRKKELLERALVIKESHYGKDHPEVAVTLNNLATANGALGDARQQKALLEQALVIQELHYGKDHPEVAITLHNLVSAHANLGEWSMAKLMAERAYHIFSAHPNIGSQHPHTQVAKKRLDAINEKIAEFSPEQLLALSAGNKASVSEKKCADLAKALRNAANQNNLEKLKELLPQIANVNTKDEGQYGRTALHWAVIKQAHPCIKLLLTAGADAMMVDNAGKSSIDYAGENPNPDALFLLLSHHYKLSLEDIELGKLLRRAAYQNNVNDVKLLLKHIKNIDEKDTDKNQRTALHWAVIQHAVDCIKVLMAAEADPHLADGQSKTAYDYAQGKPELLSLLQPTTTQTYIP